MIRHSINFEDIKSIVTAAEHMQLAGKFEDARSILLALSADIKKALGK